MKPNLFDIDQSLPVFKECAEFLKEQDWYIGATGKGAKYGADVDEQTIDDSAGGLVTKLNKNGTIKDSADWDDVPNVSGVWRSPFGWNDESVKRRAPKVWALFDYVNRTFLNDSMTIEGFPEEIAATRKIFSPKFGDDPTVPGHGTIPPPGDMPAVWTCYGIAKTGGPRLEDGRSPNQKGQRKSGSVGIHMDAIPEEYEKGYFSILINMNEEWKPSWGGDLLYYENIEKDVAPEKHFKRDYGWGYAAAVAPHKPASVIVVPANAPHTAANDKFMPQRQDYLRRIMFRCKYKDLHNPYAEED
jgi:hypothetical protein